MYIYIYRERERDIHTHAYMHMLYVMCICISERDDKNDPDICSSILENDKTNEGVLFAFSNEENTCLAFPQHLKESLVGLE